jgi:hypothetical protein
VLFNFTFLLVQKSKQKKTGGANTIPFLQFQKQKQFVSKVVSRYSGTDVNALAELLIVFETYCFSMALAPPTFQIYTW